MAVIREGSFTKAAKSLGISQPAVSQNIAEIERELNVQLFERTKTELKLTEDGKKFKEYAEQILFWYASAADAFKRVSSASLFRGSETKKDIFIGISNSYSCHLVPNGTKNVDIDINDNDGTASITVFHKAGPQKDTIF